MDQDRDIKIGSIDGKGKLTGHRSTCTHATRSSTRMVPTRCIESTKWCEITVTRAKGLLKRINKIVKATVDDFRSVTTMPAYSSA
jgi:hypothetical protein